MIKHLKAVYLSLLAGCILLVSSCIKEEPPNPEADIERFLIDPAMLEADVYIDQSGRKIHLFLTKEAYFYGVVPEVITSPGAHVVPASGDSLYFHQPVYYTVTAADGTHQKTYEVVVSSNAHWTFGFERWAIHSSHKYETPEEEGYASFWGTGNPGIALAGVSKTPESYPTRSTLQSRSGTYAAELVTLTGTAFSNSLGIRLFAGSLFTGVFDLQNALVSPLEASQFGQPYHEGRPLRFTGYYQYQPGPSFQDKDGQLLPDIQDSCALYAVLFRGNERLNATNIHHSSRILARADIMDGSAKNAWTRFDVAFEYRADADLSGPWMLAIIASSSKYGDHYRGAVGSRLLLDELQIIHE